jgi:hypothetical protein
MEEADQIEKKVGSLPTFCLCTIRFMYICFKVKKNTNGFPGPVL